MSHGLHAKGFRIATEAGSLAALGTDRMHQGACVDENGPPKHDSRLSWSTEPYVVASPGDMSLLCVATRTLKRQQTQQMSYGCWTRNPVSVVGGRTSANDWHADEHGDSWCRMRCRTRESMHIHQDATTAILDYENPLTL